MVLTLTMLISVFGFGQMTIVNANGGGISIFSADFEQEPYPEFVQMSNGGKPQFSVENGVAYINDDPGWSYGGFVFDDAISNSEYENTSIGDSKRICRRKSALGLEYSTIHD